jgi:hypothetical protein
VRTTRTKPTSCPSCGWPVKLSTSLHGERPKPGDLAICEQCFAVCQYGDELALLPFDTSQLDAGTLAEIERTIALVRKAKRAS